ncbi:hypothetical protein PYW07_012921 [Mythimna separata]|uniref:PHD-type domain-containing protein n=1 Tax=Mythimna separata TaxID=271217 RepID=A0AAD7Y8V8_MYTSE|nr:hypothetical protein PYW07_012921 [Mythimna separata]
MAKCGGCGKFLSSAEAANCNKCRCWYHRACVGLPNTGQITTPWHCPECKKNVVRDNRADTPVRGRATAGHEDSPIALMTTSPIKSATIDATQELNLDILRGELRDFKEDFLKSVRTEFQLLRDDLADLRSSIIATNERMSRLEERVVLIETKQSQPQASLSSGVDDLINQLRSDINDRDQELLGNDLQISNIPEASGENPTHTVMLVAAKLGVAVEARDIVSAERVGGRRINATQATAPAETRPRFLVVRLARRDLRDELLQGARVRRGMTTADLGMPGSAKRFYVNERLTKINRELFRCAREAGSRLGWKYVWSKRGRILARYKPGDATYHIRCEADLQRIFAAAPSNDGGGSVL